MRACNLECHVPAFVCAQVKACLTRLHAGFPEVAHAAATRAAAEEAASAHRAPGPHAAGARRDADEGAGVNTMKARLQKLLEQRRKADALQIPTAELLHGQERRKAVLAFEQRAQELREAVDGLERSIQESQTAVRVTPCLPPCCSQPPTWP